MNLHDWLSKIESFHPEAIKLGLERVQTVATKLNLLAFNCPVITVGGTNGKGSCVAYLSSILTHANYRVGAYYSPHLLSFNERIQMNNQLVTDDQLIQSFKVIDAAREHLPLTFFEFTTLAALWIFKHSSPDILVLEVGMGGRLDAVNMVDSDIAIIASIDIDHSEWLGNTREAIGKEKAGIFRPNKPAILGDYSPPASVFQQATELGNKVYCIGKDYHFDINAKTWSFHSKKLTLHDLPFTHLPLINAATSLMAIAELKSRLDVPLEAIYSGLKKAFLPARFQQVEEPIPCILDVAHNPASAKLLADNLARLKSRNKLIAVVGMLSDKDVTNTFKPLTSLVDEWYFGTLSVKRGATAEQLARHLQDFDNSNCYTNECVSAAFLAASKILQPGDRLVVFGSFYTIAEIMNLLQNTAAEPTGYWLSLAQ